MTVESIRRIDPEVVERMAGLMPWHYTEFGQNGLTYQTCRFCHQGIGDAPDGLWKYGVRHYVCTSCRDAITSQRLGKAEVTLRNAAEEFAAALRSPVKDARDSAFRKVDAKLTQEARRGMTKPKTPKQLDAIADTVLGYRPIARSKPAVQRKRRKTILERKQKANGKR